MNLKHLVTERNRTRDVEGSISEVTQFFQVFGSKISTPFGILHAIDFNVDVLFTCDATFGTFPFLEATK